MLAEESASDPRPLQVPSARSAWRASIRRGAGSNAAEVQRCTWKGAGETPKCVSLYHRVFPGGTTSDTRPGEDTIAEQCVPQILSENNNENHTFVFTQRIYD